MNLACTAKCADCDWTWTGTDMHEADKAAEKHGKKAKHSTSWHCQMGA